VNGIQATAADGDERIVGNVMAPVKRQMNQVNTVLHNSLGSSIGQLSRPVYVEVGQRRPSQVQQRVISELGGAIRTKICQRRPRVQRRRQPRRRVPAGVAGVPFP
jgi:hypothetical protein